MKVLMIYILFAFSLPTQADPHYVQALHPYIDPRAEDRYFQSFEEPISVSHGEYAPDGIHIFIYRFNQKDLNQFSIDVSCPDKEINVSFQNMISSNSTITDKKIIWTLDPDKQKQIVWFYTVQDSVAREYYLNEKTNDAKIQGPSCKTMVFN